MRPTGDDREEFEEHKRSQIAAMSNDDALTAKGTDLFAHSDRYDYSYQWTWLGLPIIQLPQDIVAVQEIIWTMRPQVIVETGIARGGSIILYSSILELLGDGRVVAVDVDIRPHNRMAIEGHPMAHRIEMIQGSSTDEAVLTRVRERCAKVDRVMVILDSDHTHQHVAAELEAYSTLVSEGQYLIVADTIIEHIPPPKHRPRPWGPGNSPSTAVAEFLARHADFQPDAAINSKLLFTSSPGGYLRRTGG